MNHDRFLGLLSLSVIFLCGCSGMVQSEFDVLVDQYQSALEDVPVILKSCQDEESARAAVPKLRAHELSMLAIAKKGGNMNKTRAQVSAAKEKLGKLEEESKQEIYQEEKRIWSSTTMAGIMREPMKNFRLRWDSAKRDLFSRNVIE